MSPRRRSSRRGGSIGLENMAGWLFADLLLVMFLVGVGAEITQVSRDEPKPEPTPEEVKPPSMDPKPVARSVRVDVDALLDSGAASARAEKKKVRKEIRDVAGDLKGDRAAMVLLFGHAERSNRGQEIAKAVAEQLDNAMPGTFKGAVTRHYWDGSPPKEGPVDLEIFLFRE